MGKMTYATLVPISKSDILDIYIFFLESAVELRIIILSRRKGGSKIDPSTWFPECSLTTNRYHSMLKIY
jgi:hypothetical protein